MPINYNPNQKTRVTLDSDKDLPEDRRAVFILRLPRSHDRDRLQAKVVDCLVTLEDGTTDVDNQKMMSGGFHNDLLLSTVEGWENWSNDGVPVNFKTAPSGCVTSDSLEYLAPRDRIDLASQAIKLLTVGLSDSD